MAIPSLLIHPVRVLQRSVKPIGMQEIKLDRHPDFTESQVLFAADESAIESVLDDRLTRDLADNQMHIEASGGRLIVYYPKKLVPADKMQTSWPRLFAFTDCLPNERPIFPDAGKTEKSGKPGSVGNFVLRVRPILQFASAQQIMDDVAVHVGEPIIAP